MPAHNAVELTADAAWLVAESIGAGSFPWVLAITPPQADPHAELTSMGVLSARGAVDPAVARWTRTACAPELWLELRYVRGSEARMLRGLVARRGESTVAVLRSGHLVTLTELDVTAPDLLAAAVTTPLQGRAAARFTEFVMPMRVGQRADDRLRAGAEVDSVLDFLGIPPSAAALVRSVFTGPRSYVEVRAGCARDGVHRLSDVGVGIVDTPLGRLLVSPHRADDGTWLSTFAPGTPLAISAALERLSDTLPAGRWFPESVLVREFAEHRT
ncbi:ESX secretion-associated protein EspG [Mycobacterium sp. DL592]|uniref:ESX secretion-associated protein EspG n=1 Tax=Mycobacterium sp. DL592 TaxID=2675524 RepID=UPI00141FF821|nr:ESX secretion-associated protein EspG [Mycobacterium sp. DL592]